MALLEAIKGASLRPSHIEHDTSAPVLQGVLSKFVPSIHTVMRMYFKASLIQFRRNTTLLS